MPHSSKLRTARAVIEAVAGLDDASAAAVEARVIPGAVGRTTAAVRASLRRAVISVDPAAAAARRAVKVTDRGVWREPLQDGMARLEWIGPVEEVTGTYTWLTAKATQAKAADRAADGPVRTAAQCRSDVLADLGALGLALEDLPMRQGRRPRVQVVVALSTLLDLDNEPGDLAGVGPIDAQVARRIAADATWRRLLTDPASGQLVEMSTDSYEPPQALRDHVITRDRTCRGLGCRILAERCDIDHRSSHPQGPTAASNLDAACRGFHRIKTFTDTTVEPDGAGGLWITLPSGRRYHRPAEPVLDHPGLIVAPTPADQPPDVPDPPGIKPPCAGADLPPF